MKRDPHVWQFNSNVYHPSQTTLLGKRYDRRSFENTERFMLHGTGDSPDILEGETKMAKDERKTGKKKGKGTPSSPIKKIKIGQVDVAIWENEGKEGGRYLSATIKKRYYDKKEDSWKESSSFNLMDLSAVNLASKRAMEFCMEYDEKRKDSDSSDDEDEDSDEDEDEEEED
jgi:hypothetical protein